jgi:CBS domain containing-hemolysin-like protein
VLAALYLLVVVLLVLTNGFFVASEFALVGVRRSRIAALAQDGHRRAKLLLELIDSLNDGYTTVAGFLMAQAGRSLNEGDEIDYNGTRFIVERIEGRSVRRVRLTQQSSRQESGIGGTMLFLVASLSVI